MRKQCFLMRSPLFCPFCANTTKNLSFECKKRHPFFCQTISWYHAGGNSHFLKGLISMGFLLYTKDSIHFCISYMDICLFNIDIFFATF